jgi:hypothetical protein
MNESFIVRFNNRRQYFEVHLEDVSPATFHRRGGGRWAYFLPTWEHPRRGRFGEIHIVRSRCRPDTVAHELLHLWISWMRAKDIVITPRNEEQLVGLYDSMVRAFWRAASETGVM